MRTGTESLTEGECQKRGAAATTDLKFSDVVCFYPNTVLNPEICKVFPLAIREPCGQHLPLCLAHR